MSHKSNIHSNSLLGISNGVSICAESVRGTLGSAGKNVILEESMYPYHRITNDGATIIDHIILEDPLEKTGLGFVKEATERSNKNSGDGSTTTTILLDAILKEGMKTGVSGMEIKKELDLCLPLILADLDKQTKKITVDEVEAVAFIAGESKPLAKILKEIYQTIGASGIIHLEGSGTYDTNFSLIEGVRFFDTGYLSPYLAHDEKAKKAGRKEIKAIYEKPLILITKRKIEKDADIAVLVQYAIDHSRPLVIFTDDMDSAVASRIILTHRQKVAKILIIKAPTLWKNYVYEDFAKITGATIVEDSSGINFKNLRIEHLGTCDKIITDEEETTVVGIQDISDHVETLLAKGDTDSKWRLAYLTTKTAVLRLGSQSETELSYNLLKGEDAIFSSKLALQKGVVVGGGIALLNASITLKTGLGATILSKALKYPIKQIIENAGAKVDIEKLKGTIGFNSSNGKVEDLYKKGIIDSAEIVKNAVRNSIGIASTILTASSFIALPREVITKKENPFDQPQVML
jgi:chaperonin GroEL